MRKQFLDDAYIGLFGGRWALYRWSLICLFLWLDAVLCFYKGLETIGIQLVLPAIMISLMIIDMWDAKITGKSSGRLKRFIHRVF